MRFFFNFLQIQISNCNFQFSNLNRPGIDEANPLVLPSKKAKKIEVPEPKEKQLSAKHQKKLDKYIVIFF